MLSLIKRSGQLISAAGSSITLCFACQLIHRNPQSDFDSGIVLLMHACFHHPGDKRRFEVYEEILLLPRGVLAHRVMQLEKDVMMRSGGAGMLMSPEPGISPS